MFHADVMKNAPQNRTLFNYSPKHGWPMLREFLGLPKSEEGDEFPHENRTTNTGTIYLTENNSNCKKHLIAYGPYDKKLDYGLPRCIFQPG